MNEMNTNPDGTERAPEEETAGVQPEEVAAAEAAAGEADVEAAEADTVPGEAVEGELQALQAEVADLKDRLLRAAAEMENLRRRTEREKADIRKFAASEFARDLLSVADNLQRAVDAVPAEARQANEELNKVLEGVELTDRELKSQFEKHGIRVIEAMGQKLDPNLHQAVVQIDHPDAPAGTVVHVMQVGYTMHDRLLRAAMVGVAKGNGGGDGTGQSVDTKA